MEAEAPMILAYLRAHPRQAARQLEGLPAQEAAALLAGQPQEAAAGVVEEMLPASAAELFEYLGPQEAFDVFARLSAHSAVSLLRHFDEAQREALLSLLDQGVARRLRDTLHGQALKAAGLADPRVFTLPPEITVAEALARLRAAPKRSFPYLYVVDGGHRLVGVIALEQLLSAESEHTLAAIAGTRVISLPASANETELRQHPAWRLYHSLPVTDEQGRLIGAISWRTMRQLESRHEGVPHSQHIIDALMQLGQAYAGAGVGVLGSLVGVVALGFGYPTQSGRQDEMK